MAQFNVPTFTNENLDPNDATNYWSDKVKTRNGLLLEMYTRYSNEDIVNIVMECMVAYMVSTGQYTLTEYPSLIFDMACD
jgi:hypothetical protein